MASWGGAGFAERFALAVVGLLLYLRGVPIARGGLSQRRARDWALDALPAHGSWSAGARELHLHDGGGAIFSGLGEFAQL